MGKGLSIGFEPNGTPSRDSTNSCEMNGHIARTFVSASLSASAGPFGAGPQWTGRSGIAFATPVGGDVVTRLDDTGVTANSPSSGPDWSGRFSGC